MAQNYTLIEIQFLHWINSLGTKILKLRLGGTHGVKLDSNLIPIWNIIGFSLNFIYFIYIYIYILMLVVRTVHFYTHFITNDWLYAITNDWLYAITND